MTRLGLCVVVLALLSALVPLHAQDSDVVPGSGETRQIPGPACHFITDWNTSRAKLCTAAETGSIGARLVFHHRVGVRLENGR